MALSLLARNHETNYCIFSIDTEDDIANLPTIEKSGESAHEILHPCCQGSVARSTDGVKYVLTGSGSWTKYTEESGASEPESVAISDTFIDSLFE